MPRPPMILTGPQALGIAAAAVAAWTFRTSLRAAGRFIRCGPDILGLFDDEDDDWVDLVGANPDLFLGPIPKGDIQ